MLEVAIPITYQDVVLIFVTVSGMRDGRLTQESYAKKVYAQTVGGKLMSAIQITTAAGMCAMVDLLFEGKLPQRGFVRQEQAKLSDFLANRFGRYYARGCEPHARRSQRSAGARRCASRAWRGSGILRAGESYLPVLDALHGAKSRFRLITCRHESGAANMAEAYGKLTGKPGICFVTRGPGRPTPPSASIPRFKI